MPANTSPVFASTPVLALAQVSAANTNLDGTGTIVDLLTGGTNGTRVEMITIKAPGTTTSGMIRIYVYDGTNTRLWTEVYVSAVSPGVGTPSFTYEIARYDGRGLLELPSGHKLRASTHNAEAINIMVHAGDY